MGKRGISAVVATVLIILITVAAVTIVWTAIIPMVKNNLDFSSLKGRVDIATSGGYTFYDIDEKLASVQVKRSADSVAMSMLRIIFSIDGDSVSSSVVAPKIGNTRTYVFNLSEYNRPQSVSVVPIFVVGKNEKEGEVTSDVSIDKEGSVDLNVTNVIYDSGVDYSARSCMDLFIMGEVEDGIYEIDPDGEDAGEDLFEVYCDMTTDGGGWTLIASYVDGSFFYDCSDVGMSYGDSCYSNCAEFSDDALSCNDDAERAIQDSEMAKLELKYVIDSSFGSLSNYMVDDFVSPAYYMISFSESMFSNNQDEYISYDFSSYTTSSMRNFYKNENMNHLELRIPSSRSNLDVSMNDCDTLELAVMMADNDGGVVDYYATTQRYNRYSSAFSGPGWDSGNNGGCHYDDAIARWTARRLGGQYNGASTYILWFVR